MRALRLTLSLLLPLGVTLGACATAPSSPAVWTSASADPAVVNLTRAGFTPSSGVTDAVLAECHLDRKIPQSIARWSPVPTVLAEDPDGAQRLLTLEVTHILAPGGGPWSGPKSMTVHGELFESTGADWRLVGSFDARRTTTRGGGTCGMLEIIADAIGKDIRPWLAQPSLNAPLGEL